MWVQILSISLFFLLSTADISHRRLSGFQPRTQEQANCPGGCRCDTLTITCTSKRFRDANVFTQIRSFAFPKVDTLLITGNRFGNIATDIFDNDNLEHVTSFNLSDNSITKLSRETFKGTPNVEFLSLDSNKIIDLGESLFTEMPKLKRVTLSKALADNTLRPKDQLLKLMFQAPNAKMKKLWFDLQEVDLSYNGIEKIDPDTFCALGGLARLLLRGNPLQEFPITDRKCLSSLNQLDLSNTRITTVPAAMYELLPNLNALDISENKLICDCSMMDFLKFASQDPNNFLNQGLTTCAAPSNYRNQKLYEIEADLCQSRSIWPHLVLLTVIAVACLFVYKRFRDRIPTPRPFQFGYQNLNQADQNAQPEFV